MCIAICLFAEVPRILSLRLSPKKPNYSPILISETLLKEKWKGGGTQVDVCLYIDAYNICSRGLR